MKVAAPSNFLRLDERRKLWYLIPGIGNVVIMSEHYGEDEVIRFAERKIELSVVSVSYRIQRQIALLAKSSHKIHRPTTMFDCKIDSTLWLSDPGSANTRVRVLKPYWMEHGNNTNGVGHMEVVDYNNRKLIVRCTPDGRNALGNNVLTLSNRVGD